MTTSFEALESFLPPGTELFGDNVVQPPTTLPAKDAREHALVRLGDFIAALVFQRTGDHDGDATIPFQVPRETIHHYNPNDTTQLTPPAIGLVPGKGVEDMYALGPALVLEETRDVFGPNTVLVQYGEYVEDFMIEVFSAKHPERRAIVAGLKEMMRASENSSALWLTLPHYFDQVAVFELNGSEYVEDPDTIRNRRHAYLSVTLRVPQMSLINYVPFDPSLIVSVGVEVDTTLC
jgi:hypothetical protein